MQSWKPRSWSLSEGRKESNTVCNEFVRSHPYVPIFFLLSLTWVMCVVTGSPRCARTACHNFKSTGTVWNGIIRSVIQSLLFPRKLISSMLGILPLSEARTVIKCLHVREIGAYNPASIPFLLDPYNPSCYENLSQYLSAVILPVLLAITDWLLHTVGLNKSHPWNSSRPETNTWSREPNIQGHSEMIICAKGDALAWCLGAPSFDVYGPGQEDHIGRRNEESRKGIVRFRIERRSSPISSKSTFHLCS